jgi:CheY-like chemotaxis protein
MPAPLILVVDDSTEVGFIVQIHGRRAGQKVVCQRTAEDGWDFLQHSCPDLLLLDRNLPGSNGWDLCRRIRRTPELAALRIALFTHWHRPRDIADGLEAGGDYVVSKDLLAEPEAWRQRLQDILAPPDGLVLGGTLSWKPGQALVPAPSASQINQALCTQGLSLLGAEVVQVVVRRALQHVGLSDALAEDRLGLAPERLAGAEATEACARMASSLVEQVGRLLGPTAAASFGAALLGPIREGP